MTSRAVAITSGVTLSTADNPRPAAAWLRRPDSHVFFMRSRCTLTTISTNRRHTFSMKPITWLNSASEGNCSRGSSTIPAGGSGLIAPGSASVVREQFLLERGVVGLQPDDLAFQCGALVGDGLA